MKAAVLHEVGGLPRYEDFPDPVAGEGEAVIEVKAVAVENIDKMIAAGTHFASKQFMAQLPVIPGFDGVGTLPDGTLVGFGRPRPPYGALAEQTVVTDSNIVPTPEGIDPAVAVVLGSAVTGFSSSPPQASPRVKRCWSRARPALRAGWRSRWPGCSAPGGSWAPDATTTRSRTSARSAQTP